MPAKICAIVLSAILLLASSTLAPRAEGADDWPCFRGPTGIALAAGSTGD